MTAFEGGTTGSLGSAGSEADNRASPIRPDGGRAGYRRQRRVRRIIGASAVVIVVAAAAAAAWGLGGADPQRPASGNLPPASAPVVRATLTQTERLGGTLGYGPATTVFARASAITPADGGASGDGGTLAPAGAPTPAPSPSPTIDTTTTNTITWLPALGAVVEPGKALYKVDAQPVVLLAGSTPLYRVLSEGKKGADVTMLETNLRAFGYTGFTVDDAFTAATTNVVKRWQKGMGLPQTGAVDVNQVVVAAAAVRVAEHKAVVGADATEPVLTYTSTIRVVTVPLEVTRQQLVKEGMTATVSLPDGKSVTGTVASIGTVANAGSGQEEQASTPTIDVLVTVADQNALGTLDAAPVALVLVVAEHKDVLTVPVGALVALAEGGYGVQVVDGGTTRYVAVKTGMFADGKVEVSGDGIAEGMTVGVPA